MDEPFSALDVLTARTMRDLVLDLWASPEVTTKSILLVTHSIEEAVAMSDRVVVLKANPGRIAEIVDLRGLPRPRRADARRPCARRWTACTACWPEVRKHDRRRISEPLPHAPIGMVLGLLEHLRRRAGRPRGPLQARRARSATSWTTCCP